MHGEASHCRDAERRGAASIAAFSILAEHIIVIDPEPFNILKIYFPEIHSKVSSITIDRCSKFCFGNIHAVKLSPCLL